MKNIKKNILTSGLLTAALMFVPPTAQALENSVATVSPTKVMFGVGKDIGNNGESRFYLSDGALRLNYDIQGNEEMRHLFRQPMYADEEAARLDTMHAVARQLCSSPDAAGFKIDYDSEIRDRTALVPAVKQFCASRHDLKK